MIKKLPKEKPSVKRSLRSSLPALLPPNGRMYGLEWNSGDRYCAGDHPDFQSAKNAHARTGAKRNTGVGLTSMLRSMRGAFPDFHLTTEDQIAEGNKVITRVTFRGTHQGDYRGIAPTGKQIKYSGIAIDRIVDGKVVEMWHVADTCAMLQQIGVTAAPPKG